MATKKDSGMIGSLLVLLGALVYIWLAYSGWNSWLTGTVGWTSVVGGLAVVSAISLLILSLVELAGKGDDTSAKRRGKAIWWGGLALFILTSATGGSFWLLIVGFLLAYIGSGWKDMM